MASQISQGPKSLSSIRNITKHANHVSNYRNTLNWFSGWNVITLTSKPCYVFTLFKRGLGLIGSKSDKHLLFSSSSFAASFWLISSPFIFKYKTIYFYSDLPLDRGQARGVTTRVNQSCELSICVRKISKTFAKEGTWKMSGIYMDVCK